MSPWRDDRRFHLITRGNVDGIVSAAFFTARIPTIRVSFVTSSSAALDVLRRDIQSREFYVVDLGATPELLKNFHEKAKAGIRVHFLDHHQQSEDHANSGDERVESVARQGVSAATLAHEFLGLDGAHEHLAALADLVEYCDSPVLGRVESQHGRERLAHEARILDYAWRLEVDDDRFRLTAARKLAAGAWPSEVPEIHRRYLQVLNEGRWERALDKVRSRLVVRNRIGVLRFGRYRTSLYGFGTRALSHVAEEQGCTVAVLINSRKELSSVSLRGVGGEYAAPGPGPLNLGRFVEDFTLEFGLTGGGHPSSAGAKIHTRDVPTFLQQIYCLV